MGIKYKLKLKDLKLEYLEKYMPKINGDPTFGLNKISNVRNDMQKGYADEMS